MSRCLYRPRSALFALGAALLLLHPAAFASKGTGKDKAKPETASKQAPAAKAPKKERGASEARTSPKPRSVSAKPSADSRSKANEKSSANEKAGAPVPSKPNGKHAPASKQSDAAKHGPAPVARPAAAKSMGGERTEDRARPLEPALKPPGGGRTAVRQAGSRLVVPPRDVAERTLAFHYANLGDEEAIAELNRRGIAWVPASPPLPGVKTPIRLGGPLHGVTIHSTLPERERRTSAFEILDARLALALDDFCALLARHDVVELVHYTMYRPPGELPPDLNKQIRHPAGLAIDVGAVRKSDGRWLAIGPHWPSDIGAKTCGEGAREHWSRAGREIVSIACEAADVRMFHFILTPHFDAAHGDHLHLEIKPDTRWFLVN